MRPSKCLIFIALKISMKIAFILLPIVYLLGNGYLFLRSLQALSFLPLWGKVVFGLLFWLIAFSLFAAIGLREFALPEWFLRTLHTAGSVWMVFLLYAVLLLIVADVVKRFVPTMGHSLWYALPVACLILVYGYINYKHPRVEEIKVTTARKTEGQTLRIVAVSDVHLGYGTGVSALQKYVDLINAQQPDVVLIAGDLIDNSIQPLIGKPFDKVLAQIHAPQGIYMVPGNHEYISDVNKVKQYLKQTPITLLQDSIVTLPGGIQLLGRDDRSNKHRQPLSWLLERTDRSRPVIVLDHQPYHLAQADSLQVDLMICGHTHRGQVFPLNLMVDRMYEQSHGYRQWQHAHIWVSSGLSLWGPPFRIGTHSDLAVIEISGI